MFDLMTLIKMSYVHQEKEFNVKDLLLILLNFVSIIGILDQSYKNKIYYFIHFLFFYLILVMLILSLKKSFIKKYSIYNRNLFSIILFCSILGFNLFVISNNTYLLGYYQKNNIIHDKWCWHMIFLNIFISKNIPQNKYL